MNGTHGARCSSLLVVIGGGWCVPSTLHSMEITVCQPSILVEYYDLMTSISTVFIVFSKYPNLYFNVGYSEMYRANGHLIRHNWIIVCPVHFRISSYFQKFPFLEITIFRSSLLIGLRIFFSEFFEISQVTCKLTWIHGKWIQVNLWVESWTALPVLPLAPIHHDSGLWLNSLLCSVYR